MDLKQATAELLEVIKNGLTSGIGVIKEQFPMLCEQILRWGIISNILIMVLSILIMWVSIFWAIFSIRKENSDGFGDGGWLFLAIPLIVVAIAFFIAFWISVFEIGKILSAPNVYLFDHFKDLATPKS